LTGTVPPAAVALALPGQDLGGGGSLRIALTLEGAAGGSVPLATTPAGTLAYEVIRPADDGLRLAFADDLRIYERMRALPRVRWASRTTVIGDRDRRLEALAAGAVPADTVVLDEPDGAAGAGPAETRNSAATLVTEHDGRVGLDVAVDADRAGHLVVADALQHDWVATVDGEPADLVPADHAGVAVAVPAGHHEVDLRYRPRGQRVGLAVGAVTALALALAAVAGAGRRVGRRSGPPGPPGGDRTPA
jgi:hypothetical protein